MVFAGALTGGMVELTAGPLGFDSGWSPQKAADFVEAMPSRAPTSAAWLRLRGMGASALPNNSHFLLAEEGHTELSNQGRAQRAALVALREKGFNSMAMIRWGASTWESETRGPRSRIPLDLREAYERSLLLARVLGDVVDGWEIDNEPDIGFVAENPETFAAFYKACALGIMAGRQANPSWHRHYGWSINQPIPSTTDPASAASLVIHTPLALPPGPYWRELRRNDTPVYAEGSNFHFYGYPEDFEGVRDAWIVTLTSAPESKPLFVSEYGYGLLDQFDKSTQTGRQRQRRFFDLTLPTITDGTITGAMAYQLAPWEGPASQNEFGLLAEVGADAHRGVARENIRPSVIEPPAEGEEKSLRELTDRVSRSIAPQGRTHLDNLSPVVIDFLPGRNLRSVKRYRGHLMSQVRPPALTKMNHDASGNPIKSSVARAEFKLVLYNFSQQPASGRLSLSLENGEVLTAPAGAAAPPPAAETHPSAPTPSIKTTPAPPAEETKRPSPPPSYVRPARPRSTGAPVPTPDWPAEATPLVRVGEDRVFARTPALELLWHAAGSQPVKNPVAPMPDTKTAPAIAEASRRPGASASRSSTAASLSIPLSLAPGERRELLWHASVAHDVFRGHRLDVRWIPTRNSTQASRTAPEPAGAILSTLIYPPPTSFRPAAPHQPDQTKVFDFSAKESVKMNLVQRQRIRATDEAKLAPLSAAPRWLATSGVEIEESALGWNITVRDLPPNPLRPAEIELPLVRPWRPSATSALSFRYQLLPTAPDRSEDRETADTTASADEHPDRFEEFDVNFRDAAGTLWGVWPRQVARFFTQAYFEPLENFTPMFFSRAARPGVQQLTDTDAEPVHSLVMMIRPRSLPVTLRVIAPRVVTPVSKSQSFPNSAIAAP